MEMRDVSIVLMTIGLTLIAVGLIGVVDASAYSLVGDMTGDGLVDAKDIKAMRVAVAGSGLTVEQLATMPQLGVSKDAVLPDMNGDGRFYYDDIEIIRGIYSGTANVYGDNSATRPLRNVIAGDVNGDGVFDRSDLNDLFTPHSYLHYPASVFWDCLDYGLGLFTVTFEQITV